MVLNDTKRKKIEEYLREGLSYNKIVSLCKVSKHTVLKVAKAQQEQANSVSNSSTTPTDALSLDQIENYINKCLHNPMVQYNTALINTAIKMLELKNKIEPDALRKIKDEEQLEIQENIIDAQNYLNTINPVFKAALSAKLIDDGKTSTDRGSQRDSN